ncbi:4-amino-4-deoxy-L-arabinose transferase-like glycosyltransferase [Nocardioides zeae]|uniref:4-amino-4-deoxy-L-arabinose transferase-like glycosyltransferase n=1 Tax=Nocardioides zeae TaxID=1457234 RepID=A0ACC6IKS0_9ACTN|nr:glycosyltransferase family 39 protein [Nocardioides zeae]MDR6175151.1 4-amino-4-deoxy-L-arabinose transferase-like glycosyltransferase [Nocardioides zeae]MDR6211356.1 4-amino-4-deoxy-L-arabinose transferase-like glycosyltransferase [Nocardioides zeae]
MHSTATSPGLAARSADPAETRHDPVPRTATRPISGRTAERLGLAVLLVGTALLYLWDLGASGWANSFYAAAAQAGSESWSAFFFGASDAGGAITVDKTPLSLWPMALSIRLFGLSSWSLLVPQALMGVGAVALLHATVRRATGSAGAGLLAGAGLALTPVATLMFRFDNPDAALVLLLLAAAWATLRALESAHPVRWLALGGALVGLAFLAKMLQAFLVLPALAAAYALFATVPWWKRVGHLLVAFAAMVVAGGWWIAIVELVPEGSRPYVGGSQDNSILELALGYNGLGRLDGDEEGSVGGGGGWGTPGPLRLFTDALGDQASWLLPAAIVLGVAGLWLARGLERARSVRAALVLMLGWLLVTATTFSLMQGIFHEYYTVALAPAVALLAAVGAWVLWRARASLVAAGVLGGTLALTAAWAFVLLERSGWMPWLRWTVAVVGLAAALLVVGARHLPRRVATAVAGVAVVAALAGPAAYSVATAGTPHTGSIVTAGPATAGGTGPGAGRGRTGAGGGGAVGGLLEGSEPTAAVTALLQQDADAFTWAAATVGSNSASGYQLASEEPVMAIGGFNGTDPSPTLEEFQTYVANGQVHWFVAGGGRLGGGPGGAAGGGAGGGDTDSTASAITAWVEENFTATTVDGVTLYDLAGGVR